MRVLVVEDQLKMRTLLCQGLHEAGYAVDGLSNGVDAMHQASQNAYAAVVLDVMLPGMDGFEVVRQLRDRRVWTPVLMLTARDSVEDRMRGLDEGADDYLVKPFAFGELLSRVRALIRRASPARPTMLRCGPLALDPATHHVKVGQALVDLSPREFAVLELLISREGVALSRAEILDHVWDSSYEGTSNLVDVYVKFLRDKIDRRFAVHLIHTVRGVGYRLATSPSP